MESLLILPDEILSMVFVHLLLEDRRSVRLTCRRFYEACNTLDILRIEELNFALIVLFSHCLMLKENYGISD